MRLAFTTLHPKKLFTGRINNNNKTKRQLSKMEKAYVANSDAFRQYSIVRNNKN